MACVLSSVSSSFGKAVKAIKSLDVQHGRPVSEITDPRKTIVPIAIASLLFFAWGLTYGLLDVMNYHVRIAMAARRDEGALLALGYYMAYLVGPTIFAGPLIKHAGYRLCMFLGLFTVGLGCMFMSLGADGCTLGGMTGGHFVIGIGVSMLERSANAYAVNCGPRQHATLRILVAQAMAGVGTVVAPFLAAAFVFSPDSSNVVPAPDPFTPGKCLPPVDKTGSCAELGSVITFYRGIGAIVLGVSLVLATLFFRTRLVPEVAVLKSPRTTCGWKLWRHPLVSVKHSRVWWGVVANFVNLGLQVAFAQFFMEHMKINACASDRWAANWMSVAQAAFVAGRFSAAAAVVFPKIFRPRYVLLAFLAGAVAFTGASVVVTGSTAIAMAVMVMFAEAPSFPMIFESATAGFEEWTPTCETLMIVSISGGGILPVIMGKLTDMVGISMAWTLVSACFAFVLTYPVALCVLPSYRKALDQADGCGGRGSDEEITSAEPGKATAMHRL
ncbi:uncharacterized protein HMPREF1541_00772 [Cyphellophora europaea CBS 101466]|uniref:Major facilitator superfamily (MFS) profile domain-containing protein n=1 Tax=Cyphellophora europaea (strain CBS 101466) TaxID=1220924 RepID=W2SCY1_CYPE1|nr:uncharacterized protein HMPREF1541_00772 [Cyphellophora europaea CBS 101466]ETN46586.1 hypothetical protein HMPREF1541_00772 [Cyphellophora europaea CBS 101466]